MKEKPPTPAPGQDLERALEALDLEGLRGVLRALLSTRSSAVPAALEDAVIELAARRLGRGDFCGPDEALFDDAQRFLKLGKKKGALDAAQFRALALRARRQVLRGEYAVARLTYELLLGHGPDTEILPRSREVEESYAELVAGPFAGSYLLSVIGVERPEKRVAALFEAVERVGMIAPLAQPLALLEAASLRPIEGFDALVSGWVAALSEISDGTRKSLVHNAVDGLLAEGLERLEGLSGIARMARRSNDLAHYRTWLTRLSDLGQHAQALAVVDEAEAMLTEPFARGLVLDAGAYFARELGEPARALGYLERALAEDPSVVRLARFLLSDEPARGVLLERIRGLEAPKQLALGATPGPGLLRRPLPINARMRALTLALQGAIAPLGSALEDARDDWSDDGHPGPIAFPTVLMALYGGPNGTTVVARLCASLFGVKSKETRLLDWRGFVSPVALPGVVTVPDPGPAIVQALRHGAAEALELSELANVLRGVAAKAAAATLDRRERASFDVVAHLVVAAAEATFQVGQEDLARTYLAELAHAASRHAALRSALTKTLARSSLVNEL